MTAKWCDRRSCRRGRTAPHREVRGGSWRRPEAATEQESPARAGGGEGEPATSVPAPRRSPRTGRNKPRLQQGLRLHESLGFFLSLPAPHPPPRIPSRLLPSPASSGRVQVWSPERKAMASNPERGEILLTELQVRAAARARGAGGAEGESLARGRGPRGAVRPPRP